MNTILSWLARGFISVCAGVGAGCITFGVMALTGEPELYSYERLNRYGPPLPAGLLSLGVGFITMAFLMWMLSRQALAAKG